jgi:hypothetical protein
MVRYDQGVRWALDDGHLEIQSLLNDGGPLLIEI